MATQPSCGLLDLPPELFVLTTVSLSFHDILRIGQTCKHLRNALESNSRQIDRVVSRRANEWITSVNKRVVDYPPSTTFPEALQMFLAHRGVQATPKARIQDIRHFASQWCALRPLSKGGEGQLQDNLNHTDRSFLQRLATDIMAQTLVALHVRQHVHNCPSTEATSAHERTAFINLAPAATKLNTGLSEAKAAELYDAICEADVFGGPRLVSEEDWEDGEAEPRWLVTGLTRTGSFCSPERLNTMMRVRLRGICTVDELNKVLGIELPSLRGKNFAYAVRTRAAYLVLYKLLGLQRSFREGERTWKMRAMVLDELYIH